ncbi:MAG: hypothetical protein HZA93_13310 [Verrucomicrobia bacterium]|nr:hypothetical protein [Verrucomicrobiota bacterium]
MKPFFQLPSRQEALWSEAKKWEHTPFFANAASRGHGVGCVELVHELMTAPAVAAAPRLDPLPRYTLDHGHHATETQLLRFLFDHPALRGRLVFVPFESPRMPGDLLGVLSGQLDHHLACVLPWRKVIHAMENHGAVIHDLDEDKLTRRTLYVLRLLEAK